MRKSFLLAGTILLVNTLTTMAQGPAFSKEEAAIMAVIENESKYFWGRDYEKWKENYVQAPYVSWTAATKDGVRRYGSWEAWNNQVKQLFQSDPKPQEYEGVVTKYNYNFRIYGNGAWVSFEQMNNGTKTWETRIMEKQKGKWKIAMVELVFNPNEEESQNQGE